MNLKFKAWKRKEKISMQKISEGTGVSRALLYKSLTNEKGIILWVAQCLVDYSKGSLTLEDLNARKSLIKLPSTLPFGLTLRELECANHFNLGATAVETASVMGISFRTVEHHIAQVNSKLSSSNTRASLHKLRLLKTIKD